MSHPFNLPVFPVPDPLVNQVANQVSSHRKNLRACQHPNHHQSLLALHQIRHLVNHPINLPVFPLNQAVLRRRVRLFNPLLVHHRIHLISLILFHLQIRQVNHLKNHLTYRHLNRLIFLQEFLHKIQPILLRYLRSVRLPNINHQLDLVQFLLYSHRPVLL